MGTDFRKTLVKVALFGILKNNNNRNTYWK